MRDLRTYLSRLREAAPDQLVTVDTPVDWRYGVTAHVTEMERRPSNPALLLRNIAGYSTPILTNLFGHVDRFNLSIGENPDTRGSRLGFYDKWNKLFKDDAPPAHVDSGPVKDVKMTGRDVDLEKLPIPRFYEQDGGRYVTAGLFLARDPGDPDELNLSYVRMHLRGRDTFGVSFHSRGHMWQYLEKAKVKGEPLEAAVIIGAHPALYLAAAAKITGEYGKAGALLGEPVELTRCETVDLPVPASAEIVLEGRVLLDPMDEGPFTEYTGYISGRSTRNQFKVTAVTRRRDAIFMAVAPSNSAEHLLLSGLPKQARISRAMIDFIHTPALEDIVWPVWATHFACFVSLNETVTGSRGLAKQLGLLLLGLDHYVKLVAVLPHGVDVNDTARVLGAVAQRCDFEAGSGFDTVGAVYSQWLDPSSPTPGVSSKMIVDATGPRIRGGEPDIDSVAGLHGVLDASNLGTPELCVAALKPGVDAVSLLEHEALRGCRLIVCVDDDIDVHDARQALWAVATRSQPADDATARGGRMVVDARKGDGWTARRATLPFEGTA
ncbi:UbiD family decarboxylase [Candidatus Bathyarchaeota archaeon]|nr:UbiD family decarboxylase [Candidatus Bathyarchaeota archaeon]